MAIRLAQKFSIENFTASNGWLCAFQKRHKISSKSLCGESGFVNSNIIYEFIDSYKKKLAEYTPENIFNCDESGLNFKNSQATTLALDSENTSGKFSKERCTLLFCCSSLGEKLPLLFIGKSKTPRCFKNSTFNSHEHKIKYKHSSKAWMTSSIFIEWLEDLNLLFSRQNRKILLLLDNAPVHPNYIEYSNVELFFYPPNTTSLLQPCDQGIIKCFKDYYKKFLNSKILFEIENENNMDLTFDAIQKKITILDAIVFSLRAWENVKEDTIKKTFEKAFKNAHIGPDDNLISNNIPNFNFNDRIENLEAFEIAPYSIEDDIDDDIFIEFIGDKIPKGDLDSESISLNDCSQSNDIFDHEINYFTAIKHINDLEKYLLKENPDKLHLIWNLKDALKRPDHKQFKIYEFFKKK